MAAKVTYSAALEQLKSKHKAKYEAQYGSSTVSPGLAAWEVNEEGGQYICHVTKCIYSTPFQLLNALKNPTWAADLAATGLVMDDDLVAKMTAAAAAQKQEQKARTQQKELGTMLKRVRHFANALCIVAKKTAESCLQESGKWPKNIRVLADHCNNLCPVLQQFNPQQPEVTHLLQLHQLSCTLIEQVNGGDVTWPETANQILSTVAELDLMIKAIELDKPIVAAAQPTTPTAPATATSEEAKKVKAQNRAKGYIYRLRKLLKKCLPMCLANTQGWTEKVTELAGVLDEIADKHTDGVPELEEQRWLTQLQEESRTLCDLALKNDPAWTAAAQTLQATMALVDKAVPNPVPPPVQVAAIPLARPMLAFAARFVPGQPALRAAMVRPFPTVFAAKRGRFF